MLRRVVGTASLGLCLTSCLVTSELGSHRWSVSLEAPSREVEKARRNFWESKLLELPRHCSLENLKAHLGSLQNEDRLVGGECGQAVCEFPKILMFRLDDDYQLEVECDERSKVVRRIALVGLPDLRNRIPDDLYTPFRAINRVSGLFEPDFNPLALIQAVNTLQPLGLGGAKRALHAYHALAVKVCGGEGFKGRYGLDPYKIVPVISVLSKRSMHMPGNLNDLDVTSNVFLKESIPFNIECPRAILGAVPDPLEYMRDFRGSFLEGTIVPGASPLEVVDRLLSSGEWRVLPSSWEIKERAARILRKQALNAVANVLPKSLIKLHSRHSGINDVDWADIMEKSRSWTIQWDSGRQEFVSGKTT